MEKKLLFGSELSFALNDYCLSHSIFVLRSSEPQINNEGKIIYNNVDIIFEATKHINIPARMYGIKIYREIKKISDNLINKFTETQQESFGNSYTTFHFETESKFFEIIAEKLTIISHTLQEYETSIGTKRFHLGLSEKFDFQTISIL